MGDAGLAQTATEPEDQSWTARVGVGDAGLNRPVPFEVSLIDVITDDTPGSPSWTFEAPPDRDGALLIYIFTSGAPDPQPAASVTLGGEELEFTDLTAVPTLALAEAHAIVCNVEAGNPGEIVVTPDAGTGYFAGIGAVWFFAGAEWDMTNFCAGYVGPLPNFDAESTRRVAPPWAKGQVGRGIENTIESDPFDGAALHPVTVMHALYCTWDGQDADWYFDEPNWFVPGNAPTWRVYGEIYDESTIPGDYDPAEIDEAMVEYEAYHQPDGPVYNNSVERITMFTTDSAIVAQTYEDGGSYFRYPDFYWVGSRHEEDPDQELQVLDDQGGRAWTLWGLKERV